MNFISVVVVVFRFVIDFSFLHLNLLETISPYKISLHIWMCRLSTFNFPIPTNEQISDLESQLPISTSTCNSGDIMDGENAPAQGTLTCATWIRRPENAHLVAVAKSRPSALEIFSFDSNASELSASPKAKYEFEEGTRPVGIAAHPSGDQFVCSTSSGDCKLFELHSQEHKVKLTAKEAVQLQGVGQQKCLAFSVDGTRFACGGIDGCLRIFEWPSIRIILEEPRAHESFEDMDFSLDSSLLSSTSTDGSARIWNTSNGAPVMTLTRNSDEKIKLCRFSKDGTKPFLFCSVQRGIKPLTVVWDISTWSKIGHKRLLGKPTSIMSISLDGKYLAMASMDGDMCVVEVKKMEVRHWSKRLHLGSNIDSLEFCPSERAILTTSNEWGVMVTKLTVPADWKEWQIYLLLLGLFLASIVAFYIFFENSDSFWNFPLHKDQTTIKHGGPTFSNNPQSNKNVWGPVDL